MKVRERTRDPQEEVRLQRIAKEIGAEHVLFLEDGSFTLDELLLSAIARLPIREEMSIMLAKVRRVVAARILGKVEADRKELLAVVQRNAEEIRKLSAALREADRRRFSLEAQTPFIDAANLSKLRTLHTYGCSIAQLADTFRVTESTIRILLKRQTQTIVARHPKPLGSRAIEV